MNMIKHTRALITLRERIHEDVEFHAKLECEMIEIELENFLKKNKEKTDNIIEEYYGRKSNN